MHYLKDQGSTEPPPGRGGGGGGAHRRCTIIPNAPFVWVHTVASAAYLFQNTNPFTLARV